ncbi:MAG: hypothetical protein NTW32_27615 [Chloroflexi bacterium]|nr:hypothetical protein [Chloroflexota bacterium]
MLEEKLGIKDEKPAITNRIIAFSAGGYILFNYIGWNSLGLDIISRIFLYLFLALTCFFIFVKGRQITISLFSVWYFAFGILGLISSSFAIIDSYAFRAFYDILIAWIVTFAFIQFARSLSIIKLIFSFFSYAGTILIILLLITGDINSGNERLGYKNFNNPNTLGLYLMISLFCILWLLIYGNRKLFLINIIIASGLLYVTALSGGRKYFASPGLFLFILLVLRSAKGKKITFILNIIIFILIILLVIFTIMNIPVLYNLIGSRFESYISFLYGDIAHADGSAIIRSKMIQMGWESYFPGKPFFGYGLDNFRVLFSGIYRDLYAHNNYVEILVDLGLIGLILYYSFYCYLLIVLLRMDNDSTGIRNFFIAFLLTLLVFEWGAVTYSLIQIQILLGLASVYIGFNINNVNNA